MYLKPISFDGFGLNTANYESIIPEDAPASWKAGANENTRTNAFPQFASLGLDGITLPVVIAIKGSGSLNELKKVFDPSSYYLPAPKKFIVQDETGAQWSAMGVSLNIAESSGEMATMLLRISQPVWVSETEIPVVWAITAPGQTQAITINSNYWALPKFEVKPTGANPGNFAHNLPYTIYNATAAAAAQYPLKVVSGWNTAALISAGTLKGDCSDWRIYMDGVEVDAWITDPNTDHTAITINVNLKGKLELALGTAIASSGAVGELQFAKSAAAVLKTLPLSGAFLVEDEIFTYNGLNTTLLKAGGVQRAARNTSMAAHASGAMVRFIEHDVRLLYGNPNAAARVNDDSKKPAFDLAASTNTQWVYSQFGDKLQVRSASWKPAAKSTGKVSSYYPYGQNALDDVWPADVLGLEINTYASKGKTLGDTATITWIFFHPFGIYSAAGSGEKYRVGAKWPTFTLEKSSNGTSWKVMLAETSPVNESAWSAFTWAETVTGATGVYIPTWLQVKLNGAIAATVGALAMAELTDVTVKLVTGNVPVIIQGTEASNVHLEMTLTNMTSALQDAIGLVFPAAVNKTLVVDTAAKTITYEGIAADAALAPYPARGEWLPLLSGANTLRYDAAYSGPVTITIKYRERMIW
jgi:hypothetical protein